jgi:amino-acid N-acetyltransferase
MVKLKKVSKTDLPLVEELLKSKGLPYEDIPSKLDVLFLGCMDEKVVGVGGVETYGNYGLLRSLVIKESFRGKGYGRALCGKLIKYAQLRGVREIYLLTTTAENFFTKKIGFEVINRSMAPAAIQNTTEFKNLCPSTATCMRMKLNR